MRRNGFHLTIRCRTLLPVGSESSIRGLSMQIDRANICRLYFVINCTT
jgi:hypothetical protein